MKKTTRKGNKSSYGIAEWYGVLFRALDADKRREFLNPQSVPLCPFLKDVVDIAPKQDAKCSKKGGVCSIRNFVQNDDGSIEFGPITATCPNRFHEGRKVIDHIGDLILETREPLVAKEIPFLRRNILDNKLTEEDSDVGSEKDDVGKIDLVFLHPSKTPKEWCAIEIQAVYFSGAAMSKDHPAISAGVNGIVPMPGGMRRPDFRSSGPKRLMPQLQIKVPSLRRWGKKMVVVVDSPFLNAMAAMPSVDHISNCDIVWCIVDYEEKATTAELFVQMVQYTTLEDSVIGLTAGTPTTLPDFEDRLLKKAIKLDLE